MRGQKLQRLLHVPHHSIVILTHNCMYQTIAVVLLKLSTVFWPGSFCKLLLACASAFSP
jgi:hypothetical protein